MPSLREVAAALYGAWRMLRFDTEGMRWFDISLTGFWHSFFAAVPIAPAYALLTTLELTARPRPVEVGSAVVVWGLAYVLGWIAFPVAAIFVTRLLALTDRYVALIVAYNWASVPQMLVLTPAVLIDASGVVPAAVGPILTFVATVYVLVYQWFVTRTALTTGAFTAAGVVVLQVVIGEFIHLGANALT